VERADEGDRDQRRLDDGRFVMMRYANFRAAAEYIAAAFAGIPTVSRVALFGSVAAPPRMTSSRGRMGRFFHLHSPRDVDIAVWIDDTTEFERVRFVRSRAVQRLWEERAIGVAHHQADVFLLDAAGRYLGRLCWFNQCPKHKPECRAVNCGNIPFLRQHDGFVLDPDSLRPDRIQVLYERSRPVHP
jgi:hypothetical protein